MVGLLSAFEREGAFVPREWHLVAYGRVESRRMLGLSLRLGAGISILAVTASPGLVARSDTVVPGACWVLALGRPFRFDKVAIVPELGARIFSQKRTIAVDDQPVLSVATIVPGAAVGIRVEL